MRFGDLYFMGLLGGFGATAVHGVNPVADKRNTFSMGKRAPELRHHGCGVRGCEAVGENGGIRLTRDNIKEAPARALTCRDG